MVSVLPKEEMTSDQFRSIMESQDIFPDFFHTAYQLACQLALYCESNGKFIPRFDHDLNEDEAKEYLSHWIRWYYAPNPYTKSLKDTQNPAYVIKELCEYVRSNGKCHIQDALEHIFKDKMGNLDIVINAINNYSQVLQVSSFELSLTDNYQDYMNDMPQRNDKLSFFENFSKRSFKNIERPKDSSEIQNRIIRAMRTKPFLLLAGISGTGKSRIVKQMAFDSCPKINDLHEDETTPGNYCLVEVKPNWHDSSELLGYESQIGKAHYVVTPFIRFLVKAMLYEKQNAEKESVPFFVCLDEMNLAPVEQYFAEFLSVLESRKLVNGKITSEPIIPASVFRKFDDKLPADLFNLKATPATYPGITTAQLKSIPMTDDQIAVYDILKKDGLRIPSNLIVVGTVNMDETTHQFSRKVIDRAMTIEMNLPEGDPFMYFFNDSRDLEYMDSPYTSSLYLPTVVKAADVIQILTKSDAEKTEVLKKGVAQALTDLNKALENTPFKIAYRVQNELVIYFYELWSERKEDDDVDWDSLLRDSVDEILMMKVLPRIEGDEELLEMPLANLESFCAIYPKAKAKVKEMKDRLEKAHFTSFWP